MTANLELLDAKGYVRYQPVSLIIFMKSKGKADLEYGVVTSRRCILLHLDVELATVGVITSSVCSPTWIGMTNGHCIGELFNESYIVITRQFYELTGYKACVK